MELAWYEAQLARAFPGTSEDYRDWHISLVRGYARIHAAALLHGEPQIWPDPRLSAVGRDLLRVREIVDDLRTHGIECDL